MSSSSEHRAFGGLGLLVSTVHGVCAGLVQGSALGLALSIGGLVVSASGLRSGTRRLLVATVAVLVAQAAHLGHWLATSPSPGTLRLVADGTVLAHASWILSLAAWGVFRMSLSRSLLSAVSLCVSLFAADCLLPIGTPPAGAEWRGGFVSHPQLGHVHIPSSLAVHCYPSDPRSYFGRGCPLAVRWQIDVHDRSRVRKEVRDGVIRVAIDSTDRPEPWQIQLFQNGFPVRRGKRYRLSFRFRSDEPRSVVVSIAQNHAPWQPIGLYTSERVGAEWSRRTFDFSASATDDDARILYDLGGSASSVEVSDVELREPSSGRIVSSSLESRYCVVCRFDSHGLRGPERTTERPPDTLRILALGDSFTFGVGVHESDTFEARLEKILEREIPGRHVEVLNAGVSGYSTRQERLAFELSYRQLQPQIVLLGIVWNDDLSSEEQDRLGLGRPQETLFLGLRDLRSARNHPPPPDFRGVVDEVKRLDRDCRDAGARLVPFVFRHDSHERWTALLEALRQGLGPDLPWFDLGPVMLRNHRSEELYVHPKIDLHPNEIAHAIAAEEIARFLRDQGLLTRSETRSRPTETGAGPAFTAAGESVGRR